MDKLNKFIQENSTELDPMLPSEGHFDRFKAKLESQKKTKNAWYFNYRIAATLFFGILISGASYLILVNQQADKLYAGLDNDIKETIYYYTSISNEMENEIARLDFESKIEKQKLLADIEQYDRNIKALLEDLKHFPNDYRIKNAVIEHFRGKTELLGIILKQIKINKI